MTVSKLWWAFALEHLFADRTIASIAQWRLMNALGRHAFSCRWSEGRLFRHCKARPDSGSCSLQAGANRSFEFRWEETGWSDTGTLVTCLSGMQHVLTLLPPRIGLMPPKREERLLRMRTGRQREIPGTPSKSQFYPGCN